MRILVVLIFFVLFHINGKAQNYNSIDTALIFSITIFNKADIKKQTHFPDVYPNIYSIQLINQSDTIMCKYDFPYLTMDKKSYNNIKSAQKPLLSVVYDYLKNKTNSRFKIDFPIMFPLTFDGAKFILIEQDLKNSFFVMQKWGSTLSNLGHVKSTQVY